MSPNNISVQTTNTVASAEAGIMQSLILQVLNYPDTTSPGSVQFLRIVYLFLPLQTMIESV